MKKYTITMLFHLLIGGSIFGTLTLIDAVNGGSFLPLQQLTICAALTFIFMGYDLIILKSDGKNMVTKVLSKIFRRRKSEIALNEKS